MKNKIYEGKGFKKAYKFAAISWKQMPNLTSDYTSDVTNNEEVIQKFYTELYKERNTNKKKIKASQKRKMEKKRQEEMLPFLESELMDALKSMPKEKMIGTDKLSSWEILQMCSIDKFRKSLVERYNTYWKQLRIPSMWGEAKLLLLPKKGDLTSISNYRPLSILNHGFKILTKMMIRREEYVLSCELMQYQHGFRRRKSTYDAIYTLKKILQHIVEYNEIDATIIYLDFKKAFDMISRQYLYLSMEKLGINSHTIEMFRRIHKITTLKFGEVKIQTKSGVGQGDSASPALFLCVLEDIIREVQYKYMDLVENNIIRIYEIANNDMTFISFADDTALVTKDEHSANTILSIFQKVAEKRGLFLNPSKTEYMSLTEKNIKTIHGEIIKRTSAFTYLGSVVTLDSCSVIDINRRCQKAWATYHANKKIWKKLTNEKISKLHSQIIYPTLTYGGVTWKMLRSELRKIDATEKRILKLLLNNTEEQEKTKLTASIRIQIQQAKYFGHVARTPNTISGTSFPKIALEWIELYGVRMTPTSGKRKTGRPQKRLGENLNEFQATLTKRKNWIQEARDRNNWNKWVEKYKDFLQRL
uniref:Reverse transcriptase domain-containing protein n=1 Tax=Parastrongyloides trichosuri TaxID=131310 RepID=A0A0N4ZZQ8_PARTI